MEKLLFVMLFGLTLQLQAWSGRETTPLHLAVKHNQLETAKILLESGKMDVNAREETDALTPLHLATELNYPEMVKLLIKHGADIEAKEENTLTPLARGIASANGMEALQVLIDNGADVNAFSAVHAGSILYILIRYGSNSNNEESISIIRKIKFLIDNGADMENNLHPSESTALHLAARYSNLEAAQLFLERGANINAQRKDGDTPLHQVAQRLHIDTDYELATLYLNNGADPLITNEDNQTPYEKLQESSESFLKKIENNKELKSEQRQEQQYKLRELLELFKEWEILARAKKDL